MATYVQTVEAHALGAEDAPVWFDDLVTGGTVVSDGNKYRVGTLSGWERANTGDYVVFVAATLKAPNYVKLVGKEAFEASYELDV